jgi:uncharacterized protein (TIGR02996 family)
VPEARPGGVKAANLAPAVAVYRSTMTTEAELLAALAAAPDDAALRLVYADWLDEHDRPRAAARERLLARYGRLEETAPEWKPSKRNWYATRRPRRVSWKEFRQRQWRA